MFLSYNRLVKNFLINNNICKIQYVWFISNKVKIVDVFKRKEKTNMKIIIDPIHWTT